MESSRSLRKGRIASGVSAHYDFFVALIEAESSFGADNARVLRPEGSAAQMG